MTARSAARMDLLASTQTTWLTSASIPAQLDLLAMMLMTARSAARRDLLASTQTTWLTSASIPAQLGLLATMKTSARSAARRDLLASTQTMRLTSASIPAQRAPLQVMTPMNAQPLMRTSCRFRHRSSRCQKHFRNTQIRKVLRQAMMGRNMCNHVHNDQYYLHFTRQYTRSC